MILLNTIHHTVTKRAIHVSPAYTQSGHLRSGVIRLFGQALWTLRGGQDQAASAALWLMPAAERPSWPAALGHLGLRLGGRHSCFGEEAQHEQARGFWRGVSLNAS